jgi:hypothetical protein
MQSKTAGPAAKPIRTLSECCTDTECHSGQRNRYFLGKHLTPDSYEIEQRYGIERRRLINRAVIGWGVVYGWPIALEPASARGTPAGLRLGAGLALDQCGRELVQVGPARLTLADLLAFDASGKLLRPPKPGCESATTPSPWANASSNCWLLRVHYAERLIAPVNPKTACSCECVPCTCGCTVRQWDQLCESVQFSLQPVACGQCCAGNGCELDCECASKPCCSEAVRPIKNFDCEQPPPPPHNMPRGGCRCLCEYITRLSPGCECGELCEIDRTLSVDLHNGVSLACVALEQDPCGNWGISAVLEDCGPRRLVKRNDLLFDLIRGCDLTHIKKIGWADWHRRTSLVKWHPFADSFGHFGPGDLVSVTKDYWIEFSRPVRCATMNSDCFAMRIIISDEESGWGQVLRVPIVDVQLNAAPGAETATEARLVVDAGWVSEAILGRRVMFDQHVARVEIEVRGDFILDCNGQAVDANAVGLAPYPTGNGTPGDTFLSTFRVERRGGQPPEAAMSSSASKGATL